MTGLQVAGVGIIAGFLLAAIIIAVWVRGRQERTHQASRQAGAAMLKSMATPANKDFTDAVLAAHTAAEDYRSIVLYGNLDQVAATLTDVGITGRALLLQLGLREELAAKGHFKAVRTKCLEPRMDEPGQWRACTKPAGHDGDHGAAGIFWKQRPEEEAADTRCKVIDARRGRCILTAPHKGSDHK